MDLLDAVKAILNGQVLEACVLADWLEDNCSNHPEFALYHKRLKQPQSLRLQTLIDAVIKFGPKKQRRLIMKIIRKSLRHRDRPNHKDVLRAAMKKRGMNWYMTEKIRQEL